MICAWIYVRSGFGTWRMSGEVPFGRRSRAGLATTIGASSAPASTTRALCTTDEAQQLHVHRTQNAGQPVSADDSLTPMAHVSGTNNELTPLASATRRASTAMSNARRIPFDGIPVAGREPKMPPWPKYVRASNSRRVGDRPFDRPDNPDHNHGDVSSDPNSSCPAADWHRGRGIRVRAGACARAR